MAITNFNHPFCFQQITKICESDFENTKVNFKTFKIYYIDILITSKSVKQKI